MTSTNWKIKPNKIISLKSTSKPSSSALFTDSQNLLTLKERRKNIGILKDTILGAGIGFSRNVRFAIKKGTNEYLNPVPKKKERYLNNNQINVDATYIHLRLKMDNIYCLIDNMIDVKLRNKDLRSYDFEKHLNLCQILSKDIKEKIKTLRYQRYRLVCVVSIIEKRYQTIDYQMRFCIDRTKDCFSTFRYECATFYIIVIVFLVYQD